MKMRQAWCKCLRWRCCFFFSFSVSLFLFFSLLFLCFFLFFLLFFPFTSPSTLLCMFHLPVFSFSFSSSFVYFFLSLYFSWWKRHRSMKADIWDMSLEDMFEDMFCLRPFSKHIAITTREKKEGKASKNVYLWLIKWNFQINIRFFKPEWVDKGETTLGIKKAKIGRARRQK